MNMDYSSQHVQANEAAIFYDKHNQLLGKIVEIYLTNQHTQRVWYFIDYTEKKNYQLELVSEYKFRGNVVGRTFRLGNKEFVLSANTLTYIQYFKHYVSEHVYDLLWCKC